jgi:hypothetical protein
MDQFSLSMRSVIELDRARNHGHDCVIKQDDIKRVEAQMVSAIGRFMPGFEGIIQRFCKAVGVVTRPPKFRVKDLPADLRRDVGLETEGHLGGGREISSKRLLDLMRSGPM